MILQLSVLCMEPQMEARACSLVNAPTHYGEDFSNLGTKSLIFNSIHSAAAEYITVTGPVKAPWGTKKSTAREKPATLKRPQNATVLQSRSHAWRSLEPHWRYGQPAWRR